MAVLYTEIIKLPITEINPYSKNAKTHTPEQIEHIKSSVKQFGNNDPIAIWGDNNIVVEGHGRLTALKELGYTEVECIRLDHLTDEERRAYTLTHNQTTMETPFNLDLLGSELNDIFNIDMADFGFDPSVFDAEPADVVHEDNFNADAAIEGIENPISRPGDIWLLGKHHLMCGDSADITGVSRLMDGARARIVFTDPPWNVDYGSDGRHPHWKSRQILNDHMSTEQFGAFLLSVFQNIREVSEPGCMTYVVMSAQEWGNLMNIMREAGYHWSSTIIWAKDSLVLSRKDYHTQYEPIWYGWLDGDKRLCPLEDLNLTHNFLSLETQHFCVPFEERGNL